MAHIVFIAVNDTNAEGLRSMSACLKKAGHRSSIIFLKRNCTGSEYLDVRRTIKPYDWVGVDKKGRPFRYCRGPDLTLREKNLLLGLIRGLGPDIIGFTVTTPLRERVKEVTKLVRKASGAPVIWGGADPTISAGDCLPYCDVACMGEGERAILAVADAIDKKIDIRSINNLAYAYNGRIIKNKLFSLISDLDALPHKDVDPQGKFLIDEDKLTGDFNEVGYTRNVNYHVVSSRGCPMSCAYCCEDFFKRLYAPEKFLRRRSPSNVIQELKVAREKLGYKKVIFEDEIFSLDCDWLEEFKIGYKKEIAAPFMCYIYPNRDIERQLGLLKEAGLEHTCLALQSGSARINHEVFARPFRKDLFLLTARTLKSLGISYYTDIITFNPFETEKDLEATLDVLKILPKPFGMCVNKLFVLKGTEIYSLVNENASKKASKALPDRVFRYYACLFWLSSRFDARVVDFARRWRILGPAFMNRISRIACKVLF